MGFDEVIWNEILNVNVHKKVKVFLWKAYHKLLLVRDNLLNKRVVYNNVCPICKLEIETIEHALLIFPWTSPIWLGMQLQMVPNKNCFSRFYHWFTQTIQSLVLLYQCFSQELWCCFLCLTLWALWKGRNCAK